MHVRQPGYSFAGSPLVEGGLVILNGGTNSGVALDANTGKVVWQSENGPNAYATPVPFQLVEQRCVAIFTEKWLAGGDATTGKELWRYTWQPIAIANVKYV